MLLEPECTKKLWIPATYYQFISLGSDGYNVNKTIWNHINTHMTDEGLHGLLPFIPCNVYVEHNVLCI